MIQFNRMNLVNKFGEVEQEVLEDTLIAAIAFTPYVKYRENEEELRSYFFGLVRILNGFLDALNEVRPFDLDKVKRTAWQVFVIRYGNATNPDTSRYIMATGNPYINDFPKADSNLLVTMKVQLQSILNKHFNEVGE